MTYTSRIRLTTRIALTFYLAFALLLVLGGLLYRGGERLEQQAERNEALGEQVRMLSDLRLLLETGDTVAAGAAWQQVAGTLTGYGPEFGALTTGAAVTGWCSGQADATPARERLATMTRALLSAQSTARAAANRTRHELLLTGSVLLALLLMLLAVGAYSMQLSVMRPLRLLRDGITRAAEGHLDTPVVLAGRDELAELAAAFNAMAARIRDSARDLFKDNYARERALQELARSEERARRLAAASFEGILVIADDRIIDCNDQSVRLFGGTREQLLAAAPDELVLPAEDAADTADGGADGEPGVSVHDGRRLDGGHLRLEVRLLANVPYGGAQVHLLVVRDITEREQLTTRMHEALIFNREIIAASPLGIIVFGVDGRCLLANDAAAEALGVASIGEVLARGFEAVPPALRRRVQLFGRRALRDGRRLRRDVHFRRADGSESWFDVRVIPLLAAGRTRLLVVIDDTTARMRMHLALNASEAQFRALVENLPGAAYLSTLDEQPRTVYVSPQIRALLGCTPEEFCDRPGIWQEALHPDDRDAARRRPRPDGSTLAAEYRVVARDGSIRWVRDTGTLVRDAQGEPQFLQGLLLDITAQKTMEQQVRRAYAVIEATTDLVLMHDEQRGVFYLNRAARQQFGIAATDGGPWPLATLCGGAAGEMQQAVLPAATRDGSWTGELQLGPAGHTLPVLLVAIAHRDEDGAGTYWSLVARDITMLQRLEQARAQTAATLAVINALADGLIIVTLDGIVSAVNPAFCALSGRTENDLAGRPLAALVDDLVTAADRAAVHAAVTVLAGGALTPPHSFALDRHDGTTRSVQSASAFIRDAGGRPVAIAVSIRDISALREAEARRWESEAMAQAIIDASTDAAFLLDTHGVFLAGNRTLGERFRRPLSDLVGRRHEDLMSPEVALRRLQVVHGVVETGMPARLEDERDGMLLDNAYYPVTDATGRVTRIAVISRDMTAQRRAEDQLRALAERLANAQRLAHLGSWEWNIVTGEESWSDETYRIFGYVPGSVQPDFAVFLSHVHPDDRARVEQASRAAVEQGTPYDIEHRIVRPDGSVRVVHEQGEVVRDATGSPLRKRGTMLDITERVAAAQAVRQSEERYRSLFTSSADGIFFTDMHGILLDANDAFIAAIGGSAVDIRSLRLTWHDLLPENWRATEAAVRRDELLPHGQTREFELELQRRDGTSVPVSVRLWLLRDEGGEAVGTWGIVRDITEKKAAAERITAALAEMERSNRELEQFAYVASHDLQEPLTVIAGYVELLAHRYAEQLDDKARRYIGHSVESVQRMQAMIHGLLEYSRVGHETSELEWCDGSDLAREALQNLEAAIRRNGATVTVGNLPRLHVRRYELVRLLQNLIENALKYRGAAAPVISVTAQLHDGMHELRVADNGIGIPPKHRERVFQIFQRLHTGEEYQGTGIGLAICKRVVEKYGGRIRVEENPGGGTVFAFTLRREEEQPHAE